MNTNKSNRPLRGVGMAGRLWAIMMVLVLLTVGFMWIFQIVLMERNYIESKITEVQTQLEPIMVENGRLTCRLTAYHAGTTIVRCAAGRSSSAAYAVSVVEPEPEPLTDGDFVASVSGEKYHRKDCTFAGRIAAENRVYFLSAADAQAAGYAPCSRCLGS